MLTGLLVGASPAATAEGAPPATLTAYSPGGTHEALAACAERFRQKYGVRVDVVKASPAEMSWKLRTDGDLYFGGAEYMLKDFVRANRGVLDLHSAQSILPRRVGIVVRKGNPLEIKGTECLQRGDVDLLAAQLEKMSPFHPPGRDGGALRRVYTGQEGLAAWRSDPELDAWVTYRSWHVQLEEETEFIEIPGDRALRYTHVAATSRTPHRKAARDFIAFLKSPEARQIFAEHGWE